jgi:hypothetical protein
MPEAPATVTLLLPARARFAGQVLPASAAKRLGRADRLPDGQAGERAQLLRHFDLLPRGWPVAALTREVDACDATGAAWLRADPAYMRPDLNGARLLAIGDSLRLTQADVDAFLPALRPLFGDAGFPLDAPTPSRWYLRLPREAKLPPFAAPDEALGADLFEHLPEGAEGRGWRALLSEAGVVLHNHPRNAERAEQGLPPVNALWFWGGGVFPDHVRTRHAHVRSNDLLLQALSKTASADCGSDEGGSVLVDYRALAAFDDGLRGWLDAAASGRVNCLSLDFADGARFAVTSRQRWRLWRRPMQALDA